MQLDALSTSLSAILKAQNAGKNLEAVRDKMVDLHANHAGTNRQSAFAVAEAVLNYLPANVLEPHPRSAGSRKA